MSNRFTTNTHTAPTHYHVYLVLRSSLVVSFSARVDARKLVPPCFFFVIRAIIFTNALLPVTFALFRGRVCVCGSIKWLSFVRFV